MKIALVANTDWYLYGYRKELADELRERGHQLLLVSPPGQYVTKLKERGNEWKSWEVSRRGLNIFGESKSLIDLVNLYRQYDPDLVHHFTAKAVIFGSFAAKFCSVPQIVNSITGLGVLFVSKRIVFRMLRSVLLLLYKLALSNTVVVFQNTADRDFLVQKRVVSLTQSHLIRSSGVNPSEFRRQAEPQGSPVVLLASRLIFEKGVVEFVKAAEQLIMKGLKARFVLAGRSDEGNPSFIPEARIIEWVEQGLIEWIGWESNMKKLISQSHILCFPSYYGEGVPKVLLEAGSVGRPVVASDIPGCRELIEDGVNGILVRPRDVDALSNSLETLIRNSKLRTELGNAFRKTVLGGFTTEAINNQTINLYSD